MIDRKISKFLLLQTQLANTAQDNPNQLNKLDAINYLVQYIETDTVLYHSGVCTIWDILHQNDQAILVRPL